MRGDNMLIWCVIMYMEADGGRAIINILLSCVLFCILFRGN